MTRIAPIMWLCAVLMPEIALGQSVIANRAIPGKSIITEADISLVEQEIAGAYVRLEDAVGLETRVTIYAGRPLREGELGPPAVIERNEVVILRFNRGGLLIETEGKALGRGGVGDILRVMNLSSRTTVSGTVTDAGIIEVR